MKSALALITTLDLAAQLQAKPLKIVILAGQSNMQGHAKGLCETVLTLTQ